MENVANAEVNTMETTTTTQDAQVSEATENMSTSDSKATTSDSTPEININAILAENARLKAEYAKDKSSFDRTASELAALKKQIRASKSAEEQRAEEEKEQQAAIEEELKTLRKQIAMATISKKVLAFVGDEDVSNTIASHLYGAEDPEGVIDELCSIWKSREKKLRIEYSKLPAPASGGTNMTPEEERRQRNNQLARELGESRNATMKNADNGLRRFMGGN